MDVYLVFMSDYDSYQIYGIASTQEKADQMWQTLVDAKIESPKRLRIEKVAVDSLEEWFGPDDERSKV